MDPKRRDLLGAALAAGFGLSSAPARAATDAAAPATAPPPDDTLDLWPGAPPDPSSDGAGEGEQPGKHGSVSHVMRPRLNVYRPAHPDGSAVLVIAGGGYDHIELGNESTPACRWLASLGVTAFELVYRLPGQGWSRAAPLQDGQRAMRTIRARAKRDGLDPARIAIMGFSAGGHLAGMTAVEPDAASYARLDAIDDQSARPDFAALLYPVLTLMPPFDHTRTRLHLVGERPDDADSAALSVNLHVDAHAPPMFLAQALDDPVSPVDNTLLMFAALRAARVPAALHVFQRGGHGWGLGAPGSEEQAWPGLFEQWARLNRLLR